MIVSIGIFQDRGDPDRGRTESLDVIQLLFDALEIATVSLPPTVALKLGSPETSLLVSPLKNRSVMIW